MMEANRGREKLLVYTDVQVHSFANLLRSTWIDSFIHCLTIFRRSIVVSPSSFYFFLYFFFYRCIALSLSRSNFLHPIPWCFKMNGRLNTFGRCETKDRNAWMNKWIERKEKRKLRIFSTWSKHIDPLQSFSQTHAHFFPFLSVRCFFFSVNSLSFKAIKWRICTFNYFLPLISFLSII